MMSNFSLDNSRSIKTLLKKRLDTRWAPRMEGPKRECLPPNDVFIQYGVHQVKSKCTEEISGTYLTAIFILGSQGKQRRSNKRYVPLLLIVHWWLHYSSTLQSNECGSEKACLGIRADWPVVLFWPGFGLGPLALAWAGLALAWRNSRPGQKPKAWPGLSLGLQVLRFVSLPMISFYFLCIIELISFSACSHTSGYIAYFFLTL